MRSPWEMATLPHTCNANPDWIGCVQQLRAGREREQ